MTKAKIIDKGLETIILQERFYLAKLNSPFVVNVLCSFQDKNNLFIVMELLSGGDLQFHILNYDYYFTETQLKFLMTNLILGIEYIHKKGLIHCNLKPDNIMFDSHGFAKIIGFGDSCLKGEIIDEKLLNVDASEYMAPEVLDQEEIDFTADLFSLGTVGYKLISGKEYNEEKDIDLTKNEKLKEKYSDFCLEFISKLLKRNKNKRLGSKEYEKELKQHDF
jgi:serine/threonine protein kinase